METATTALLELEHISKSFDHVRALQDVSLTVGADEIVGLLGDNGAGKSTLIKVITGFHTPDSGQIRWKGEEIHHLSVQRARDLGIETVYQERALADQQTLWRNIFMGRERTTHLGLLDLQGMRAETEKLMLEFLRFTSQAVTPDSFVGSMSGGERQGVAIARALHFEAELVVLDEPTMGLSVTETRKTLDFVRGIKDAGKACIFIDHNLFNVHEICERVVVIDRGRVAGEFRPAEMSVHELVEQMRHVAETGTLQGAASMSRVEAQTGLPSPTPAKTPPAAWHKTFPVRYGLQLGTFAMALVLWTVLAVGASETWLHFDIYSSLMSSVPLTGMIALSLTLVVIAREIDLSFGSVMAVGAWVFVSVGQPELGLLAGLAAGLGVGLLNGLIVVRFGIPSLVATIGTWFFWGGIVVWLTGGKGAGTEFAQRLRPEPDHRPVARHPGGVLLDGRDRDRALDPAEPAPLRRPRLPRRRQRAERPDDGRPLRPRPHIGVRARRA